MKKCHGRIAGLLLICAVFSGCATNPNPRQGGFADGVAGIVGGTYDNRIATREKNLRDVQDANATLENQNRRLREELNIAKEEEETLAAQLDKMKNQIDGLSARLRKVKARNRADRDRQGELRKTLANLQNRTSTAMAQKDPKRETELRKEVDDLKLETDKVERQIKKMESDV